MINIRPLRNEDASAIVRFNENTTEDFLHQWGGGRFYKYPITTEQIMERLKNTENTRHFAIQRDKEVIGTAELDYIKWDTGVCSVCRFLLDKKERGKGYGTEALKILKKYAFEELKMRKVRLCVFDFNTSAYRCYEKAGFKAVGQSIRPNGWIAIEMEAEK